VLGKKRNIWASIGLVFIFTISCSNDDDSISNEDAERNFKMGFTTWNFGPNLQNVNDTYDFIATNADVYVEHLDNAIPWNAWINDLPLPAAYTSEIEGKANRRILGNDLVLSVGLLNLNRDDLAQDLDGSTPPYDQLNDATIEAAYTKHVNYLVSQFSPDYLVIAIEVNELWLRNQSLWNGYELLINEVISKTKSANPSLKIGTSISLHNLHQPEISNADSYISAIWNHVNQMDFVGISYYPFLKNQSTQAQFQETLNFLHTNSNKPIAFVESGHIAENLVVPGLGVSINGNATQQNLFLETLLSNAETNNYEMVNWWAYRDYDALWEVFPEEVKDIGQLWRDTGLLDENGEERPALATWQSSFGD
jgi:hypothetical protein